jgi:branched-chain amino acid transport system ATP-binding protein
LGNSISFKDVHAGYGAVTVLSGVSISLRDGETVALLGTNGNGKTTIMRCMTGQVVPTKGEIIVEVEGVKHNVVGMSTEAIVDLGVALVPEGRRLFPKLTVEENLLLGAFRKAARAQIDKNLAFCYEAFPRLAERKSQLAGSMSGGEQQMLALGRALMSAPKILLIDEPSVGLAPILVARMIDKIAELKQQLGLTVLMAEQNFEQATRIADRGYVLVHGKIELDAENIATLRNSDIVKKLYLGLD